MINKAMFYDRNQLNEFTSYLKNKYETTQLSINVQLRNQMYCDVIYQEKLNDGTDECFRTEDWSLVWHLDGSSCKSSDLDLCYLKKE